MKKSLLKKYVLIASMALTCSVARADFNDVWTNAPTPWSAEVATDVPEGVSLCSYGDSNTHTIHMASTTVYANDATATIKFTYTGGGHMLMIAGVDVIASDGTTVISDYHQGKAGGSVSLNVYTLTGLTVGETYTLRYFVCHKATGGNAHSITSTNGKIAVTGLKKSGTVDEGTMQTLLDNANAAYECIGVGYPIATAASRTELGKYIAFANADKASLNDYNELTNALTAFKTDGNILLPENGKAYTIANYSLYDGGSIQYLNYTAGSALSHASMESADASVFVCRQLRNGVYVFVTEDGKVLTWKGGADGYKIGGTCYGYSESYPATQDNLTDWNEITISNHGTEEKYFGMLYMTGRRSSSAFSPFIAKGDGSGNGWDQITGTGTKYLGNSAPFHSSAWYITEVEHTNTAAQNLTLAKIDAKLRMVGTISDAVCDYTCLINGEKAADLAAVYAAVDAAATVEDVEAIVNAYHINLPESGKYYRLKGISGNYIDASEIYTGSSSYANQMAMNAADAEDYSETGTIFYLDSQKRFKNLQTGTYIQSTSCIGASKESANTWSFAEYIKTARIGYITLTANSIGSIGYQLHDNAGTRADRCTSICSDRHAWKLEEVEVEMAAKVGQDDEYKTLGEAFAAVEDGQTITILSDVTFTAETSFVNGEYTDGINYTGDKSFTVDFGGYTVTDDGCVNDYVIYLRNLGEQANEVTFVNGTIKSKNGCWATVCVGSSSALQPTVLNLNQMTLINSNGGETYSGNNVVRARNAETAATAYNAREISATTVNVNDGTTITSDGASYGVVTSTAGAVININSGAIIEQTNSGTVGGNNVYAAVGSLGTVNINAGATITSDNFGVHTLTSGNAVVNIAGGTITAEEAALVAATNSGDGQTATINVTDGTITGQLNLVGSGSAIVLTGGAYSVDVTDFCAEGYECVENEDGTFSVQVKNDGPSTAITEVEALANGNAAIYDLTGRRIAKPVKGGIYIINGNKVLVK